MYYLPTYLSTYYLYVLQCVLTVVLSVGRVRARVKLSERTASVLLAAPVEVTGGHVLQW